MALNKSYLVGGYCFGADPEIFVMDKTTGKIEPAFKFLQPKEKPGKTGSGQNIFWDGFAAEFNTTPGYCLGYHTDSVRHGLFAAYNLAQKHNKNLVLTTRNTIKIHHSTLKFGKDEYIQLGCEPSKNIYGLSPKIMTGREINLRSAGGHIHFGDPSIKNNKNFPDVIKALDLILGVCCVSLFAEYDDPNRREYYGLPGEYRLPKHGVEYRTLSNSWLIHPMITNLVFELARRAARVGSSGQLKEFDYNEEEVVETIRNCDVRHAHEIMLRNEKQIHVLLSLFNVYDLVNNQKSRETIFKCMMEGVDSFIDEPDNLAKNWYFNSDWYTHCGRDKASIRTALPHIMKGKKI